MLQLERLLPGRGYAGAPASRRILVVNGHPRPDWFCGALCDAYEDGAQAGRWEVERLNAAAFASAEALAKIRWARHIAVMFPLWNDRPPAMLHELFERYAGVAAIGGFEPAEHSARSVILMEMPAFAHRALLKNDKKVSDLRRRLSLPGLCCDDQIFIGGVTAISAEQRSAWLRDMHGLGLRGA